MSCPNPDFPKFCAQTFPSAPVCDDIEKEFLSRPTHSAVHPYESGLATQLFEMSKLLIEKGAIRFRSSGTCMYPSLKPGDVLFVQPKNAAQIKIGEIAVYRHLNRIFAHRTVATGEGNGQYYIFTRPDRTESGMEGPFSDKDIIGVISNGEGKSISQEEEAETKGKRNLLQEMVFNSRLQYHSFKEALANHIVHLIYYIQGFGGYPFIARNIFSRLNFKLDFSIHTPLGNKINSRFYEIISGHDFPIVNPVPEGNHIPQFTIILNFNSKPASFLSFIARPEHCPFPGFWVTAVKTRMRFRGTGMEERVFDKLEDILRQSKVTQIFVSIPVDDAQRRDFFEKIGFKELHTILQPSFLPETHDKVMQCIILGKELQ